MSIDKAQISILVYVPSSRSPFVKSQHLTSNDTQYNVLSFLCLFKWLSSWVFSLIDSVVSAVDCMCVCVCVCVLHSFMYHRGVPSAPASWINHCWHSLHTLLMGQATWAWDVKHTQFLKHTHMLLSTHLCWLTGTIVGVVFVVRQSQCQIEGLSSFPGNRPANQNPPSLATPANTSTFCVSATTPLFI